MNNRNRFIYFFAVVLGCLLLVPSVNAQVNQGELENLGPVEFINYEGPYSRIETRAQIRDIGYSLGQIVKAGTDRPGALGRYFVIHSVSDIDGFKLDADIFGLGPDVGVDHIRNMRLIIQGYLEAAYEYTESDAALLAEYITIYNAVYRGDLGYFGSRYKTPVMDNLTLEKAGLSIRYDEWPGQTLMLIPLGTGAGGVLSSVDTSSITDTRVVEQLRQEPDMSIEQRQDMVDLKEREADEASQQAAITREAIQQEEERIAQEREQAQQREQQAREEQVQIAREREEQLQAAREREEPGEDQEAIEQQIQETMDQRLQEAEERIQEAREEQAELDRQQEELQTQIQEAEQQEVFAEQKATEAQEERQQIAEDQQAIIRQEPPATPAEGILGVAILNPDTNLGRLVKVDNSGREVLRSPLNTVNPRTVTLIGSRIFAIAGESRGAGAIRIVEINPLTLEMQKQGDDDIAAESLLWLNGQDLYAITVMGGDPYMARFNMNLELEACSPIPVHPNAALTFIEGYAATQRADGSAVHLNPRDLTERPR